MNIEDRTVDGAGTNAFEDVAANSVDLVRLFQDGVVAHATPPFRHEKRVEEVTRRSAVHHDCYAGGAETIVHSGWSSTGRRHQGDAEGAEEPAWAVLLLKRRRGSSTRQQGRFRDGWSRCPGWRCDTSRARRRFASCKGEAERRVRRTGIRRSKTGTHACEVGLGRRSNRFLVLLFLFAGFGVGMVSRFV